MVSPTLSAQAGEVRHKFAAAASANSLLESLVSGPGQAKSQAEDTLSLCLQAHAALVLLGLMRSSAFAKTFALVHSIVFCQYVFSIANSALSTTILQGTSKVDLCTLYHCMDLVNKGVVWH